MVADAFNLRTQDTEAAGSKASLVYKVRLSQRKREEGRKDGKQKKKKNSGNNHLIFYIPSVIKYCGIGKGINTVITVTKQRI